MENCVYAIPRDHVVRGEGLGHSLLRSRVRIPLREWMLVPCVDPSMTASVTQIVRMVSAVGCLSCVRTLDVDS